MGLFGHEMHRPIRCFGNSTPAIFCRWANQTSKAYRWRHIGLTDWLFDLDQDKELQRLAALVLTISKAPAGTQAKVEKA